MDRPQNREISNPYTLQEKIERSYLEEARFNRLFSQAAYAYARDKAEHERLGKMDDDSLMPFGNHKDTPMRDVPARYLDWLSGQPWIGQWPLVLEYINENRDVIDSELELDEDD